MLDWVQAQCMSQLGFEPYPGTLNIAVSGRKPAGGQGAVENGREEIGPA